MGEEGFDAFVRARLPHLLSFGRVLTGSEDGAADLVQDALERALLHWDRIESRDSPEGYVRRIMINRQISLWRRFRRERVTDQVPEQPSEPWTAVERRGSVWAAVRTLPPRQRAVIALRYLEDLSEAETARILGCSLGTVKSQASKAMDKLRQLVPTEGVR